MESEPAPQAATAPPQPPTTAESHPDVAAQSQTVATPTTAATRPPAVAVPSAMQQLLEQVLDNNLLTGAAFYLLVTDDSGVPALEKFDLVGDLVRRLAGLLGQPVSVHVFMGHHLLISRGPLRHLLTPFGALPLFAIPGGDAMEIEETGYIGTDPAELTIPAAPSPQRGQLVDEPAALPSPPGSPPDATLEDEVGELLDEAEPDEQLEDPSGR